MLARALGAQVILLHVLSLPDRQARLRAVDTLDWQLRRAEAESYLHSVCVRMQATDVACTMHVVEGDAAEQIVDFARECGRTDTDRQSRAERPERLAS